MGAALILRQVYEVYQIENGVLLHELSRKLSQG